jgi:hypothetical protein
MSYKCDNILDKARTSRLVWRTEVAKDQKATLVVVLRGHDRTPLIFLRDAALNHAKERDCILVGLKGYCSIMPDVFKFIAKNSKPLPKGCNYKI